jgi:lysophospholipase L1-like esterase
MIPHAALLVLALILCLARPSTAAAVVRPQAPSVAGAAQDARQDDARPVVSDAKTAPETPAVKGLPTLYIVGDSTLKSDPPLRGWGQELGAFFDPAKINVVNRAIGGRSSRTFQNEGRWDKVVADLKPGDFVLIQFGHNDVGRYDDPAAKGRPSLHGEGEETAEVPKGPGGAKEIVHTFGWYMRKYGADARAKGATVIFCSMIPHKDWKDGKVQRGERESFVRWTAGAAKATGAAFIDLNEMVAQEYEKLGPEKVESFFADKRTHTSPAGAALNARLVVAGLRGLPGGPFDRYLAALGNEVKPMPAFVAAARRPLPVPANPRLPSLFLIGDSTVRNGQGDGSNGGQWGWGEPLAAYFDPTKINVVNRAVGGLSSRTYLTGGFWNDTKALIKPGDFVLIQFGHNDSGAVNDTSRARASLRGVGEETQEIDNLLTKQHEVVHTYGWYLRTYIADARARGAIPIVCSPVPRKGFTDGKAGRNTGTYGGWAADVARSEKVAFVPLNEIIARKYDALGPEKVEPLFADANTHTSLAGAELNAASVIAGLKALKGDPLAPYFSSKARGIAAADMR